MVFISYRREDSRHIADRIDEWLVQHFGRESIFKDIYSIELGWDFRKAIRDAVGRSDVLLAVIGPRWASAVDAQGKRRVEDPVDFVRIEVESALERDIPIIPLLVDDANIPGEDQLPPSLQMLPYRNGLRVRPDPDFPWDMGAISSLSKMRAKTLTNSLGMKLVLIPAGEFLMGSPDSDKDAYDDEKPQHRVRITQAVLPGDPAVTVGQFRRVVESAGYRTEAERDGEGGFGWTEQAGQGVYSQFEGHPKYSWRFTGFEQTDEHPVVNVTWEDAIAFCNELSKLEGLKPYYRIGAEELTGGDEYRLPTEADYRIGAGEQSGGEGYRLPTEAEWEYACRAGSTTKYGFGDDASELGQYAWYDGNCLPNQELLGYGWAWYGGNAGWKTHPVGQKRPNDFGPFDMHGNVWEWCWDWYDARYYSQSPDADPAGPYRTEYRVIRGGGFYRCPRYIRGTPDNRDRSSCHVRSANRNRGQPCSEYSPGRRSPLRGYRHCLLGFRVARVQSGR